MTLYSRGQPLVFKNNDDLEREFEEYLDNEDKQQFMLEKIEDDKKIGIANFEDNSNGVKNATIGTYIGEEEEWNKGLGKEITLGLCEILFFHKNYDRLSAWSSAFNKRAKTVLESTGFQKSGKARKSGYIFGKRVDWLMFDLLREEYMEKRQQYLDEILGDKKEKYINHYCKIRK